MATEGTKGYLKGKFNVACRGVNAIGGVMLVGMMLLISADVLSRWLFNTPIDGTFEIIELMMAATVSLGLAYAGVQGAHVTVDFLVAKLSKSAQRVFDLFNHLISTLLFALMCWKSFEQAAVMRDSETTTMLLEIQVYPLLIVLGVGAGLLSIVYLMRFFEAAKGRTK